jgi:hypothetical protein
LSGMAPVWCRTAVPPPPPPPPPPLPPRWLRPRMRFMFILLPSRFPVDDPSRALSGRTRIPTGFPGHRPGETPSSQASIGRRWCQRVPDLPAATKNRVARKQALAPGASHTEPPPPQNNPTPHARVCQTIFYRGGEVLGCGANTARRCWGRRPASACRYSATARAGSFAAPRPRNPCRMLAAPTFVQARRGFAQRPVWRLIRAARLQTDASAKLFWQI